MSLHCSNKQLEYYAASNKPLQQGNALYISNNHTWFSLHASHDVHCARVKYPTCAKTNRLFNNTLKARNKYQ